MFKKKKKEEDWLEFKGRDYGARPLPLSSQVSVSRLLNFFLYFWAVKLG